MTYKLIWQQAKKNLLTKGISLSDFEKKMKSLGVSPNSLVAKQYFYHLDIKDTNVNLPKVEEPKFETLKFETSKKETSTKTKSPLKKFATLYWLKKAEPYGFKNIEEVKSWQKENGLEPDGKFGPESEKVWNELNSKKLINLEKRWYDGMKNLNEGTLVVIPRNSGNPFNVNTKRYGTETIIGVPAPSLTNYRRMYASTAFDPRLFPYYPSENYYDMQQNLSAKANMNPDYRQVFLNELNTAAPYVESPTNDVYGNIIYKQGGKMTLKYQQGGQASSLDAVMQFVQALAQTLQADPNQVILAAQLNPDALKSAVQVYQQTLDIQQAAQAFSQALQSQAQAAKHGAKLNYLKALKNQCAEDEELVYFKKGGKVGCGCKKKEDGGEMKKEKKESAIDKFKKMAKGDKAPLKFVNPNDTVHVNGKAYSLVNSDGSRADSRFPAYKGKVEEEDRKKAKAGNKDSLKRQTKQDLMSSEKKGGNLQKDCGGSKLKKGDKVCPKCGKVHAAGAGCMLSSVKKFKMHRLGGSLNGVPFMLQGTSKGGVQYRFRRSTNDMNNGYKTYSDLIMMTLDPLGRPTYDTPPISAGRIIYVTPLGNDTIFYTNNDYIFNKTPKGDLNLKKAKLKFYQLIKKSPIEGEEYRMTPYWNSNHINLDMVRNRALKGN